MMKDQEKIKKDQEEINIELNIAGEPIRLTVPFEDQELNRTIEDEINRLYSQWRHSFPNRSEKALLAMMLYRYASYYKNLTLKYQQARQFALECINDADAILGK